MELAKAYVQIIPSAKGIQGNIQKAIGGEVESAGAAAGASFGKNLVGTLGKVIAAAGIGKIIKDSISEGANYEQLTGGVETLFKDSADVVMKYAQDAYKTAGMSANQYMETATSSAAAMISSLEGDTVKAADLTNMAVMDMSDNANKMGSDISSIQTAYAGFAKGNFTMLDNLKLGYGGTKSEMERLLAKAKEIQLQQGIVADYSIDSYADIVQAIHVVSDDMGIIGTTAAEAEKTVSGSLSMMKSSWANLLTAMASGQGVSDAFVQLADSAMTFVGNIVPMISNVFAAIPELIKGGFTAIAQTDWSEVVMNIINSFKSVLDSFASSILSLDTSFIDGIITGITTGLPNLLITAAETITTYVTGLIDSLPGVIDSATEIIGSLINGISQELPNIVASAGEVITNFIDGVLTRLPDVWQSATQMMLTMTKGVTDNIPKIVASIVNVMKNILTTIAKHLPQLLKSGIELIAQLAAGIIKAVPKVLAAVPEVIKAIWDTIKEVDWAELGGAIISGIINGIKSMGSALWDAITDIASNAFSAVKSFFEIGSPSKLMRDEIGRWIPPGIAEGIEGSTDSLTNAMQDMAAEAAGSYDMNVLMSPAGGSTSGGSTVNYGGITINVQADSVQKSKDFVDWLERQLVVRQKSRSAVFA